MGLVGAAFFAFCNLFVAARLISIAIKHRALPELYLGTGFFLTGFFGLVFMQVISTLAFLDQQLQGASLAVGLSAQYVGLAGMALFMREAYARGKPLASALYLALAAGVIFTPGLEIVMGVHREYAPLVMPTPRLMFGLTVRTVCTLVIAERSWAAYRAFRPCLSGCVTRPENQPPGRQRRQS